MQGGPPGRRVARARRVSKARVSEADARARAAVQGTAGDAEATRSLGWYPYPS